MSKSLLLFFLLSTSIQALSEPIDSLLNIIHKSNNDSVIAATLFELINQPELDDQKRAEFVNLSFELAEKSRSEYLLAHANLTKGTVFKNQDTYDSARVFLEKSLIYFERVRDTLNIATVWNAIGYTYAYQANYDVALNSFLKGLEYAQYIEKGVLKGRTLNNIGAVYEHINDHEEALRYYKQSYQHYLKEFDPREIALTTANIGVNHVALKQLDSAKHYLMISKKMAESADLKTQQALTRSILSMVYSKENDFQEAKKLGLEAIEISKIVESKKAICITYFNFASALFNNQSYQVSKLYLDSALTQSVNTGLNEYVKRSYELHAKVDSANGDFESAYGNYLKYVKVKEAIANADVEKQIASLQSNFDLKLKKKENDLLKEESARKENVIRNQRLWTLFIASMLVMAVVLVVLLFVISNQRKRHNVRLSALLDKLKEQKSQLQQANNSLSELNLNKNRLLSVIGHDLKGPVGNLESLLDIMIDDFDLTNTKELSSYLKMMQKSASSTFVLLENLLSWARSQQNEIVYQPRELRLGEIVENTMDLLSQLGKEKEVKIVNKVSTDTRVFADKNMMMVVLRNLISNAVKFSHKGGFIEVFAKSDNNQELISIQDEGVGMSQEIAEKVFESGELFSRRGTEGESGSGLGLKLSKEFVLKHGGKIWVESEIGKGSTFYFTIPRNV